MSDEQLTPDDLNDLEESLNNALEKFEVEYDESQLTAINLCTSVIRIAAVSGSAGCGKTTIMREVYKRLSDKGWRCVMCAPTGKAARRITQATGIQAMTVHKLLEFPSPGERDEDTGKPLIPGVPQRHITNPLDYDCILIDEAPMVSDALMRYINEALPPGGIIRMFGDMNQLPPVEDGNKVSPFWDILNKKSSRGAHGTILSKVYRQEGESGILDNSIRIIAGRYPTNTHDFVMYTTNDHVATLKEMLKKPNCPNFGLLTNQIISPMRKWKAGSVILNEFVRKLCNPKPEKFTTLDRHSWDTVDYDYTVGIGDKVVMCKNWYDLGKYGVMNGEVGIIEDITDWGELIINFEGEVVAVPREVSVAIRGVETIVNPQKDIELAYVLTTHKTQGSEYTNVVYLIDVSHKYALFRNNFYTAVTRAKRKVWVLYHPRAMTRALAKESLAKSKSNSIPF